MFINRERPNSVRITPSVGDGGVDILDRGGASDGSDLVFQVKRYTGPLKKKQKDEIEESLDRLLSDPRWEQLGVRTWYLVTPWDPTPEAELWLQELGEARGLHPVWLGLTHVEQLAAKYPDVIDYYLEGGRSRIQDAYEAVSAYFGVRADTAPLDVATAATALSSATAVLQTDPHYQYELRFGVGEPTPAVLRPMLAMTWIRSNGRGKEWVAVDIVARCAASETERPITINGTFRAALGTEFAEDLRTFIDFGAPFTTPVGGFEGTIDAPGGLGGTLQNGSARVFNLPGSVGDDPELRFESLNPDGQVVASTELVRTERTEGAMGLRVVLTQRNHVFEIEDRRNQSTGAGKRHFRFADPTGEPIVAVQKALEFLNCSGLPNAVRVSRLHASNASGSIDPAWELMFPPEIQETLTTVGRLIDTLAELQAHTATVIRTPDLFAVNEEEFAEWDRAASILRGGEIQQLYPEGHALSVELAVDVAQPQGSFAVLLPLTVHLRGEVVRLGDMEMYLEDPTLIDSREVPGGFLCSFTTPDRHVTFRHPGMSGDRDSGSRLRT